MSCRDGASGLVRVFHTAAPQLVKILFSSCDAMTRLVEVAPATSTAATCARSGPHYRFTARFHTETRGRFRPKSAAGASKTRRFHHFSKSQAHGLMMALMFIRGGYPNNG